MNNESEIITQNVDEQKLLVEEVLSMRENIISFLASLRCPENDLEDITQKTLIRATSSISSFNKDSSLKTWVFTIARNLFIDLTKKNYLKKEIPVGNIIQDLNFTEKGNHKTDSKRNPAEIVKEKERMMLLQKALDQLKEPLLSTLIAHAEGKSYEEIAEDYGVPIGTVGSRIYQARKELDRILDKMGVKDEVRKK